MRGPKAAALEILKRVIRITSRGILHGRRGAKVAAEIMGVLPPSVARITPHGALRFTVSGPMTLMRANTLLSKEPETISWIDSFRPGACFWDVGANVGVYTLYAALHKDVSTLAFEPSALNYHLLVRNVALNDMADRVSAFCLAFTDFTRLDTLSLSSLQEGGALHSFGTTATGPGNPPAAIKQSAVGFAIDDFIDRFKPRFPNHLKIDVDGIEELILDGASQTVADERLESILVELDASIPDRLQRVTEGLAAKGFQLATSGRTVTFQAGDAFLSARNYIFRR